MPEKPVSTTLEITVEEDAGGQSSFFRRFFIFDLHLIRHIKVLWMHRYLMYALTQRGIRARYKQSLIGIGWAVLTPLAMTAVITYLLSRTGISDKKPFPCPPVLYLLFMTTFWNFFSRAMTNGSTSLVSNMDLVTKVYFPREVLPISSVMMNMVDLFIGIVLWVVVAAGFSYFLPDQVLSYAGSSPYYPHWGWVWLPMLLFFNLMFVVGLVFITSTMQVYFRDVGHLVGLGMFLWMLLTPVFYPLGAIAGGRTTSLININPMTGLLDGYQLAIISRQFPFEHNHVLGACAVSVLIFVIGYSSFKHEEHYFADVV